MNAFEALCKLASDENWCWKLGCTTCGHMHFRHAFLELANGKHPNSPSWIIHSKRTSYENNLGKIPLEYTEAQKRKIMEICRQSDLKVIAANCKFPDWLGYLGLILAHMHFDYLHLSRAWSSQLAAMVNQHSGICDRLIMLASSNDKTFVLSLEDLEACENLCDKEHCKSPENNNVEY